MRRLVLAVAALVAVTACSSQTASGTVPGGRQSPASAPTRGAPASAAPSPSRRAFPPYYIESLRSRRHPGGAISIGPAIRGEDGFTTYTMSWPSSIGRMTGTMSMPDGGRSLPVVIINHGFTPVANYVRGLDAWKYGDTLSSHGFITIAPSYPGYDGSDPAPADLPAIVATAVTVMDLVGSLPSLPRADPSRVVLMGHSNGGGVCLIVSVVDPRVKAFSLLAPVSSDMSDNARRWWLRGGAMGPLGDPSSDEAGYAHISPRNYLGRLRAPVLVIQGTADEQIPAGWTQATVTSLQAHAVPVKFIPLDGATHILEGSDLDTTVAATETWFRAALHLP